MGSPALTKHPASRHIMSALSFIAPILDLAQNDFVQSKVEEAAKLFYNNANVTINLVPALVGGGLLLLLLIPLLALLFQPAAESSGYGAPEYRSDEGYEDFRALFTNLLDSDSASPQFELTKRMQAVAGPVMSRLSDAASKLIQ